MAVEIGAKTALRNRFAAKADWAVARRRLRTGVVVPAHKRSFRLKPGDTIFTMGSCFARNIEKYLVQFGCRVPAYDFALPAEERLSSTPNHALTLFTPPMFLQTVEWAERIYARDRTVTLDDCEQWLFRFPDQTVLDLGLAAVRPTGIERVIARRQELFDLYADVFRAECVLITPGLVEAWFDTRYGIYTNSTPLKDGQLLDETRYTLRVLDYNECYQALARTVDVIRTHNPGAKFLITVSPVPLRYTFTDQDILVADSFSKSVLRTVCQQLTADRPGVDYFPSFEAVKLSTRGVWQKDRRHVSDAMVDKIVQAMIAQYVMDQQTENLATFELPLSQKLFRFLRMA